MVLPFKGCVMLSRIFPDDTLQHPEKAGVDMLGFA